MSNIFSSLSTLAAASLALVSTPLYAGDLEPSTQAFLNGLTGSKPIYTLSVPEARDVLESVQKSVSVPLVSVDFEDRVLPIGPTGKTRIRTYRPKDTHDALPLVIYSHGGGWVLGSPATHDRFVRELAVGANAIVVFVDFERSPEARYPIAIEQIYSVLSYVAAHPAEFGVDAHRIALAGDSVGGNMSAVVAIMAKERQGPPIKGQLLLYPVTDASMSTPSYTEFADGPWLTKKAMAWFWDQYLPHVPNRSDIHASPILARTDQLKDLPPALILTGENDVLRDEGERYGRHLAAANVRVTSIRYNGTIHDFLLLNPIAQTPAARSAVAQSIAFLREAFTR